MAADKLPDYLRSDSPKLASDIEKAREDICPKCGGDLDTGWECNRCGFDARPLIVPGTN